MKNILYCTFFMLLAFTGFAQDSFEPGYYINSKGLRTEGYLQIINFENINTTGKLYFKKELKEEVVKLDTGEIVEFGVGEELKFQKAAFQMDDMSFHKDFDRSKDLNLKWVNLFLNVLIEGEATLYSYDGGNDPKYFYSVKGKGNEITQLAYKKYISGETIKENNDFKEKLFNDVRCENQTFREFVSLKYEKKDLVPIFEKFNKCNSNNYKIYRNKFEKSTDINISAIGGLFKLESNSGFTFGVEFELVTPSEKLAFFSRLKFESVKVGFTETHYSAMGFNRNDNIYKAEYKAMDLLLGIRYFFKLNKDNKIFAGAAGGINSSKVSGTLIRRVFNGGGTYETNYRINSSGINFFPNLSIGYVYKNKYAADLEIDIQKIYLQDESRDFTPKYNKIGINLRYIFN